MPKFQQSKTLPYNAKLLYDLVLDVEKYPEFLPWCTKTIIISRNQSNLIADMIINFKAITEKYRSNINYGENEKGYFINVEAISGPFKNLQNKWLIHEINENSCLVEFDIDFSFHSIILDKLIGLFFDSAARKMVSAFEERAKKIHELNLK